MKKYKLFLTNHGVSLVQTLLGAAVVGGLALVLARVGLMSTKIQRSATNSVELNQLTNMIQKLMLNNIACTATLKQSTNFVAGPNNHPTSVITPGATRSLAAIYDIFQLRMTLSIAICGL